MVKKSSTLSSTGLLHILRPVARFCIKRSLKIQDVTEVFKQALVEVAEFELKNSGKDSNVSKLAVMTGIHRRDVMRLTRSEGEQKQAGSLVRKIIGQWEQDKSYIDSRGRPRMLSFEGVQNEFTSLVSSVSGDISPYTILHELERVGAVERKNDKLKLIARVYTPSRGDEKEGFRMLSSDIEDLINAVSENIYDEKKIPNLHIKTTYDNVIVSAIPKIREWIVYHGEEFHKKLREYIAKYDKDLNPSLDNKLGGVRIAVGTFSIANGEESEE